MTDSAKTSNDSTITHAENLNEAFAQAETDLKPLLTDVAQAAGAQVHRPVEEAISMSAAVIDRGNGRKSVVLKICGKDKDLIYELADDEQILSMMNAILTLYRKVRPGNVHY